MNDNPNAARPEVHAFHLVNLTADGGMAVQKAGIGPSMLPALSIQFEIDNRKERIQFVFASVSALNIFMLGVEEMLAAFDSVVEGKPDALEDVDLPE